MVESAPVRPGDLVLDLGAGDGALTAPLLERGARVLAIELHAGRAARLRERFDGADVTVVQRDLADLRLPARPFRVVANPPFAATAGLLRLLVRSDRLLSADLVLQRAAAYRWVERASGSRGRSRRSVDVGIRVPRSAFRPPPRVDAAVLTLR